jgi:hypothetical protein
MSNSRVILFLRNVNGKSKWINVGYEKIWIHLFWKIFTNGKYVGEFKDGKKMVTEYSIHLMEVSMLGNSRMGKNMVKE